MVNHGRVNCVGPRWRQKQQNAQATVRFAVVRLWSKMHPAFRAAYAVSVVGIVLFAWLTSHHLETALAALTCLCVTVSVLAGPVGRAIGLPAYRPDEAYHDTLRRWRQERSER